MSWTLRLAAEILEEFASARHARDRQGRTRREITFDPRKEDADREAGRREWKRLRREEDLRRPRVPEPAVEIASPAVSLVGCVRCRREVEIREGCREPVRHEPCASARKAGSNGGRPKKKPSG
jgi:hypothetical protein